MDIMSGGGTKVLLGSMFSLLLLLALFIVVRAFALKKDYALRYLIGYIISWLVWLFIVDYFY